ncbi:Magnesium transporter NIPA2, partial [Schistosoma japonicum]
SCRVEVLAALIEVKGHAQFEGGLCCSLLHELSFWNASRRNMIKPINSVIDGSLSFFGFDSRETTIEDWNERRLRYVIKRYGSIKGDRLTVLIFSYSSFLQLIFVGDGSLSYLCEWMWWMGFILMGVGEFANFLAYTFAPAMLVTPLGGLSVLVSALLSVHFLNERLNCIGGFGCCICLLGSTLIVLHAPKEQNLTSLQEMWSKLTDPPFIIYSFFIVLMSIVLICILGPRYGKRNPIIFTLISGSIGSLSVIACKGIGIGLKDFNLSWYNLRRIVSLKCFSSNNSLIMPNRQSYHSATFKSTMKIHSNKQLSFNKLNSEELMFNDHSDTEVSDTVQLL